MYRIAFKTGLVSSVLALHLVAVDVYAAGDTGKCLEAVTVVNETGETIDKKQASLKKTNKKITDLIEDMVKEGDAKKKTEIGKKIDALEAAVSALINTLDEQNTVLQNGYKLMKQHCYSWQ